MYSLRAFLAAVLCVSLCAHIPPCLAGPNPALGVLTQASGARVNDADAFAGLSVFDGEQLSTEKQGRLGMKVGATTLAFRGESRATIHGIAGGAHVDMAAGALFFTSPENAVVEVHAGDAMLRPEKNQLTQAEVTLLAPKVLQIAVRRGTLAFSYHEEYQSLPEGETFRIYLDAPAGQPNDAAEGTPNSAKPRKVAYFILGAAGAGAAVWGINELVGSGNGPESPAKP
jgi:hypothetical protein